MKYANICRPHHVSHVVDTSRSHGMTTRMEGAGSSVQ